MNKQLTQMFCNKLFKWRNSFKTEFVQNGFKASVEATEDYTKSIWNSEKLKIIRSILGQFDHKRGHELPVAKFKMTHLWSIVLFTMVVFVMNTEKI